MFIWLLYGKGWLEISFLGSIFFWLKDKKIKEMIIASSLIFQGILRHNSKKCQVPSDLYLKGGLHCQRRNYHHTTNFFRLITVRHKLEKNMTESWISNITKMYPVSLLTKKIPCLWLTVFLTWLSVDKLMKTIYWLGFLQVTHLHIIKRSRRKLHSHLHNPQVW